VITVCPLPATDGEEHDIVEAAAKRHEQPSRQLSDALAAACAEAGIAPDGARLLRMHSNTVFYLPASNAVARINTGLDGPSRVAASLAATGWLAGRGFATVRPKVNRPVVHGVVVVSFWEYEETVKAGRSPTALAALVRELHSFRDAPLGLSSMPNPVLGTAQALQEHPGAFDGDDREWLAGEISACEQRWDAMRFALPAGLIHGDAHPNNLLYTRRGVLLGDWDHVSYGPREWDLVQAVYFHRRFPAPGDDLDAAARSYGWDLRSWPGVDDLVGIREVSGLGSYIRTAAAKPFARAELAYRIRTLRERDTTAPWNSPSRS
jgi:phosphotransferase family enzyme